MNGRALPDLEGLEFVRLGHIENDDELILAGGAGDLTNSRKVLGPVVRVLPGYARVYDITRDTWRMTRLLAQPQEVTFRYVVTTEFELNNLRESAKRQADFPNLAEVTGL